MQLLYMGCWQFLDVIGVFSCIKCYPENDWQGSHLGICITQHSMDHLKRAGLNIRSIREQDWVTPTKSNVELEEFLDRAKLPTLPVPRDVLFGSRTNAICLYFKANTEKKVCQHNFASLYPFISKTKLNPFGPWSYFWKTWHPSSLLQGGQSKGVFTFTCELFLP